MHFMGINRSNSALSARASAFGEALPEACHSGWTTQRTLIACGLRVRIRTNAPAILDKFLSGVPNIWKASSSPRIDRDFSLRVGTSGLRRNGRSWHQLYEDQQIIANSADLDSVLEALEIELKVYLAEMAKRRVFLHAGAVGWKGRAILLPGPSFSGKTSMVADLVRAGATYYSDECAVLDRYGRVHPYSTPLAVREPGSIKQKNYSVEQFGGTIGVEPLRVGLVIVSRYQPGERWNPRMLSPGQAILELLANTIPVRRKPKAVLSTLQSVVSEALVLKGLRGEASETARLILEKSAASA